jgi:hypothetical protein
MSANISVGAKHDRNQYGIITNNLYAVMLLQASKTRCTQMSDSQPTYQFPIPNWELPIPNSQLPGLFLIQPKAAIYLASESNSISR